MQPAREIRAYVARWRKTAKTQRYPAELKELVVDYGRASLDEGASLYRIAQEVEIPEPTVARWVKTAAMTLTTSTPLLPVRVKTDTPSGPTPVTAKKGPVVVAPQGWRVEGLSVDDIATLLGVAS